jgi:hypothetical protein
MLAFLREYGWATCHLITNGVLAFAIGILGDYRKKQVEDQRLIALDAFSQTFD